jgi:hypothetical protein
MAAFYLAAGVVHLPAPDRFLPIVPDFVPMPREGRRPGLLRVAQQIAVECETTGVVDQPVAEAIAGAGAHRAEKLDLVLNAVLTGSGRRKHLRTARWLGDETSVSNPIMKCERKT